MFSFELEEIPACAGMTTFDSELRVPPAYDVQGQAGGLRVWLGLFCIQVRGKLPSFGFVLRGSAKSLTVVSPC